MDIIVLASLLGSLILAVYLAVCYVMARGLVYLDRQPVPRTPKDYGMDFRPADFRSSDGVGIKGWLIPGTKKKLVVITHVGGLTKYGSTKRFRSMYKLFDEEIEFLKVARHLHGEGYWVLMFDFRNHGESGRSPNGGKTRVGLEEYLDVSAAMDYARLDKRLKDMAVGFVSFCMGANSTIIAMSRDPGKFRRAKCMVAVQPISMGVFVRTYLKSRFTPALAGLLFPAVKKFAEWEGGYRLGDLSPAGFVKGIRVPTLYVQTRNDPWTEPGDIMGFYENTRSPKDFLWLEGLSHRFQGYQYFGDHPGRMLEWLEKWM